MASGKSGSFELSGNNGITVKVTWSETYDIATNKSVVSIDSLKVKGSSWYGASYYLDGTIKVGGSTVIEFSSTLGSHYAYVTALNTYANVVAASSSYASSPWESGNITHDSDGSKSVVIAVSVKGYVQGSSSYGSGWSVSGSKTVDLTTIPRASDITSAANVTLGNACSVKWTPKATAFRYKLEFSLGDWSYTTDKIHPNKTSAYTYTGYNIPLEVASELPSAKTGTMTVTLYTYSGSNESTPIGDDSATFTVTVPNSSDTKPTVTMTLSPVSSLEDTFAGLYIQGKTKVKAALSATGKYDATIKSYSMEAEGETYDSSDSYTSDYLSQYGSITIYGYAKDSRGYTGSTSKKITVIAYSKPQILAASGETDVVAARCDASGNLSDSGTYLMIKAKRSYSKVKSGDVQYNFCKIRYRYKVEGGSYSSWITILSADSMDSNEIVTDALLDGTLAATSTYVVQVQAIDDIGEYAYTTITIPTDKVYMHRNGARNSLGIGKYVEDDNMVDIAKDITLRTRGPIDAMGGGNIDTLVLGIKLTATADTPISLNNYKTPGNYYSPNADNSQYITDSPYTAGGFGMTVREMQTTGYIRQELFYGRTTWIRHYDGSSWSDWWRYLTTTMPETAAVDYVVEAGTDGVWTYQKWKSGIYQMFTTINIRPSESTVNGTLYRTNNMTIDAPFTISSAYVSGSAVGHYWITNGGKSGTSAITLRLMSDKVFSISTDIEVRLMVVGEYA